MNNIKARDYSNASSSAQGGAWDAMLEFSEPQVEPAPQDLPLLINSSLDPCPASLETQDYSILQHCSSPFFLRVKMRVTR